MTRVINSIIYSPVSDNSDYVGVVACDSALDQNWQISPIGSIDGNPANVNPAFLIVDNISNAAKVTIVYGPYVWTVPAFSRSNPFRLPSGQNTVLVNATIGVVTLYFVENPNFVSGDANLYAIQKSVAAKLKFPVVVYTAPNSPQQAQDEAAHVELVPTASNINYNLLEIAASVENGWTQFVHNSGSRFAILVPFGGDTINGIFTAGVSMILLPNESGILWSDGSQWFYRAIGDTLPDFIFAQASTSSHYSFGHKRLVFNLGVAQAFDLLGAGNFPIGWRTRVVCQGAGRLSIVPAGADLINSLYSNALPLLLSKGDYVDLFINESGQWSADGRVSFTDRSLAYAGPSLYTLAHGLQKADLLVTVWLECTANDGGYVPGQRLNIGFAGNSRNDGGNFYYDATNVYYTRATNGQFATIAAGAGNFALAANKWNIVCKAECNA